MEQLLGATFPSAELVDGESLRARGPPGEVRRRHRRRSAPRSHSRRSACGSTIDALTPGVRERDLVGVFEEHMAVARRHHTRVRGDVRRRRRHGRVRSSRTARSRTGDLVHLRGGVLRDGWEGWLSRSAVCGGEPSTAQQAAAGAWRGAMIAVIDWCRPGTSVGELRSAAAGVTVDGVGMGHEELSDRDVLEPGMVLAIEATVDDVLGSETVLITPSGIRDPDHVPARARLRAAAAGGRWGLSGPAPERQERKAGATPSGGQDRGGDATDGRSGTDGRAGAARVHGRNW